MTTPDQSALPANPAEAPEARAPELGVANRSAFRSELQDTDPMPFGKYKGEAMQDVPASYLHWLWTNGKEQDKQCRVADYIRRNLTALKQEHKDGIW